MDLVSDRNSFDRWGSDYHALAVYVTPVESWAVPSSPIVLDLNGDGVKTLAASDTTGGFDLHGDGNLLHSNWVSKEDAFLVVDSNHNGKIDNVNELFGGINHEAFEKLATYDTNGDGVVDAKDAHFNDLLVWCDANSDHESQPSELVTLQVAGVKSLNIHYDSEHWVMDENGVAHGDSSSATLVNGKTVAMTDLWFQADSKQDTTSDAQTATVHATPDGAAHAGANAAEIAAAALSTDLLNKQASVLG